LKEQNLPQATGGVVMGAAGTDVALEAGDVVLMGYDLRKIPFAVRLGRRMLRNESREAGHYPNRVAEAFERVGVRAPPFVSC
jgi:hypothetical protein